MVHREKDPTTEQHFLCIMCNSRTRVSNNSQNRLSCELLPTLAGWWRAAAAASSPDEGPLLKLHLFLILSSARSECIDGVASNNVLCIQANVITSDVGGQTIRSNSFSQIFDFASLWLWCHDIYHLIQPYIINMCYGVVSQTVYTAVK